MELDRVIKLNKINNVNAFLIVYFAYMYIEFYFIAFIIN